MKHQFKAWALKAESDGSFRLARGVNNRGDFSYRIELFETEHHAMVCKTDNGLLDCIPIIVTVTVEEIPT